VAATDYIRAFPDQIRPYVGDRPMVTLGTDGYGRSDFRRALRAFFEVDRHHVVLAALRALGEDEAAAKAIETYDIDSGAEAPWLR
jgi:pyruvate dehydrogenase E1 component